MKKATAKKPLTHNLIFIGEHFYAKSGSMMSSIYEKSNGKYSRFDWGMVSMALSGGDRIKIRPANASELKYFKKQLLDLI